MKMRLWGRACLAAALVAAIGAGVSSASVSAARTGTSQVALGPCWLTKLGFSLGEDANALDYVTRWRGGGVQTLIQGTAPRARYWSITLYHARRGKLVSYYDQQLAPAGQGGSFSIAIGGTHPSKGIWIDPAAGGGDNEGYVILRIYAATGGTITLPMVTYTAQGALPSVLTSCSSMTSDLRSALMAANKARPGNAQTAMRKLWPNNASPFRVWSQPVNPLLSVPAGDVTGVSLLTQLADPNAVYHAVLFNLSLGDLVLHGTLPAISTQAPATGLRYLSVCAYTNVQSRAPLACLDDRTLQADAHRAYTLVVSPDQPSDTNNWLNPGSNTIGAIIMRWVLPKQGPKANLCLPAIAYRQPGDTVVPSLPPGC